MIAALKEQVYNEDDNNSSDQEDGCSSTSEAQTGEVEELNESEANDEEDTPQKDVDDFENREDDHTIAFLSFKRMSCFAHTLQLVVRVFDDVKAQKMVLRKVHKLVSKVNKSTKATEKLISKAGKKLVADCPTRWSSTFLMLVRLVCVKTELSAVLEDLQWDNLPISYWKQIENMVDLLKPFAQYTQLVSTEETTTISMIIPVIIELQLHLEQMSHVTGIVLVVSNMQRELERRFEYITNPLATNFDPLFVMCTYLNLGYRDVLNDDQVAAAKRNLVKLIQPSSHGEQQSREKSPDVESTTSEEPPSKKFKRLKELLSEKRKAKEDTIQNSSRSEENIELIKYSQQILDDSTAIDEDPFIFWQKNQKIYPLISSVALDLLSIPPSTAPVERIFSTGGEATTGRRNRLTDFNLEREILIRQNKKYLQ